jgi:hypothetical protein
MKRPFLTDPKSIHTLNELKKVYQELPFYKRFLFRIATFPFSLWSWSSSKNPANIHPSRTTQRDIDGLMYFFKHCRPSFFRNAFGIKGLFEKSTLNPSNTRVANQKQASSTEKQDPPIQPSTQVTQSVMAKTETSNDVNKGGLSFFSSATLSSEDFLTEFFKNNELSTEISQTIRTHFNKLALAANTKEASHLFKLSGALFMMAEPRCIAIADSLMSKTPPTNDADKHILSARLKANSVIEKVAGPLSVPAFQRSVHEIWHPFNASLMASLTEDEARNITNPSTFARIIESVLIPDTLMMGMHPLQKSVLIDRHPIAYNPRIQFIDMNWENDFKRHKSGLSEEILADFNRRTFSLDYSDPTVFGRNAYVDFIKNHDQQYQRVIFDWSCLCGVQYGYLFLQRVLANERMIYVHGNTDAFWLKKKYNGMEPKNFTIPGKVIGHSCGLEQIESQDRWFVLNAKHPAVNKTLSGFYAYQRTNLPFDAKLAPSNRTPINTEITPELVNKARLKLKDEEYNGNQDRVINALIDATTTRAQATKAVTQAAKENAAALSGEPPVDEVVPSKQCH